MEKLYTQLTSEVTKIQDKQKALQKHITAHQKLYTQLTENECVKEDLQELNDTNIIYKLIGPALVKEDLSIAKETVDTRLKYIKGELERQEKVIEKTNKEIEEHREKVSKIQAKMQQEEVKMPGKVH